MVESLREFRKFLEPRRDYTLVAFLVRDMQVTRDAGLTDLAWTMSKNHHAHSEAEWLLDELEKQLNDE